MGIENWRNMLSQNTVAVCDVDYAYVEKSLAEQVKVPGPVTPPANMNPAEVPAWVAKQTAARQDRYQKGLQMQQHYTRAPKYSDYREMLDKEKSIDAVMVATPDHMHAMIALRAMQAKKHLYVQKPLTYSVMEARAVAKAARDSKVVTQMGNQGHSSDGTARIREIINSGILGPISAVHVWTDRAVRRVAAGCGSSAARGRTRPIPDRLSWDLFLGAVPAIPYDPMYHPFSWRGWVDFGVSALGGHGRAPARPAVLVPRSRYADQHHRLVHAVGRRCEAAGHLSGGKHGTVRVRGEGQPRSGESVLVRRRDCCRHVHRSCRTMWCSTVMAAGSSSARRAS